MIAEVGAYKVGLGVNRIARHARAGDKGRRVLHRDGWTESLDKLAACLVE
jgi:hypothetical protein